MIFTNLLNKLNAGEKAAIASICSANKFVIEAAMSHSKNNNYSLLIESTSNQVDQFGGYTGMTPAIFRSYVTTIANKIDYPLDNLVLGGDHLGPNVWKNLASDVAMKNAEDQIRAYILVGYSKIHLDTSFALADDSPVNGILTSEIVTNRAAQLCKIAEETFESVSKKGIKPVYVIGTDVPIPGGAINNEEEIKITSASDLEETIGLTKKAFYSRGLEEAWERVIAVVVQPGVEFSDLKVLPYSSKKNEDLIKKIESFEGLYFEAHSTDYQKEQDLKNMVADHFAILKVGPWLTFALREALFSLAYIERELLNSQNSSTPSNLVQVLENEMNANPKYWKSYYKGSKTEIHLGLNFSYSDRIRYYWPQTNIAKAVDQLIYNINSLDVPEYLISQFLPVQYKEVRDGKISNKALDLILSKITEVLSIYHSVSGENVEK